MFDIPISGIDAAYTRMAVSAHNVANINTEGYTAYGVTQSELQTGGTRANIAETGLPVNYATEAVEQMISGYSVQQNMVVIRAINKMTGSLINLMA